MRFGNYILIAAFLLGLGALSGCEDSEKDDLAKAQECLDNVSDSNTSAANDCLQYVSKYDSQQANVIKCSLYFIAGGLTTTKIVNAYKSLKSSSVTDKEAVYIGTLSLTSPSASEGYTSAKNADTYCKRTGIKGLMYLSSLAVIGSALSNLSSSLLSTDFSSPPTEAQVQAIIDTCKTSPSSCEASTIGTAVESVSNAYCSGSNSDSEVCTKINNAIDQAGGASNAAAALFCLLDGTTYNSTTGACN